jgi:hypothetical protein
MSVTMAKASNLCILSTTQYLLLHGKHLQYIYVVLFKKDKTSGPKSSSILKDKMKKLKLYKSDPEVQSQMKDFDLVQHMMGKKLSMSDNCSRMRRRCSVRWRSWSWDST